MQLSPHEKHLLYERLAQLLRSGMPLPKAVERLAATIGGNSRRLLRRLHTQLDRGLTVAEAVDRLKPTLSEVERSSLSALSASGRLVAGLEQLASYFEALARARREIITRMLYPILVLNLAPLLLNLPIVLQEGVVPYFQQVARTLVTAWAAGYVVFLVALFLNWVATTDAGIDSWLRLLPGIGKIRRAFATARFTGVFDMQTDAGVNVMDSVLTAGRASGSGLIWRMARKAVAKLRKGETLGPQLSRGGGALPREAVEAFTLAEETGELHRTLPQLRQQYQEEAFHRLRVFSEWAPQILLLGTMLYVGWQIVEKYREYLGAMVRRLDAM